MASFLLDSLTEFMDLSHFLGLDHFSGKQKVRTCFGQSTREVKPGQGLLFHLACARSCAGEFGRRESSNSRMDRIGRERIDWIGHRQIDM